MEKEFETFGPEWEKEMMKFKKSELILMIAELRKSTMVEAVEKVTLSVLRGKNKMIVDYPGLTVSEAHAIISTAFHSFPKSDT
jgi:hypothetical protein